MSEYMEQKSSEFFIAKKDFDKVLKAIKNLMSKAGELGSGYSGDEGRHFAWVGTKEVLDAKDVFEAISEWRWSFIIDENNENIIGITFDGQKLGDDKYLFNAIAPFVKEGSFIEISIDNNGDWRWEFIQGKCLDKPVIVGQE
jgi:hypothetical protein